MEVEDLFTDLADGVKLLKLLEIISGEKLGKPNNGRMRVHKIENLNKSLAFLHTKVSEFFAGTGRDFMSFEADKNALKFLSSFREFNPNNKASGKVPIPNFMAGWSKICDIPILHGK